VLRNDLLLGYQVRPDRLQHNVVCQLPLIAKIHLLQPTQLYLYFLPAFRLPIVQLHLLIGLCPLLKSFSLLLLSLHLHRQALLLVLPHVSYFRLHHFLLLIVLLI